MKELAVTKKIDREQWIAEVTIGKELHFSPIALNDLDHIISCISLFNFIIIIPAEFTLEVIGEPFA